VYFELDRHGLLKEFSFEGDEKAEMPAEVACMAIGAVPAGRLAVRGRARCHCLPLEAHTHTHTHTRTHTLTHTRTHTHTHAHIHHSTHTGLQRSRFLAVGCEDNTVRVLSVDPDDCLQPLSMQALPAKPVSLCINETQGGEGEQSTLYLSIGLENGVLLKTVIDPATGDLSDTRTRYVFTLTVFWEFLC
jgi:hypothetical protein